MLEHYPVITHIAGETVTVQGRYMRQRCSWCGSVLIDYDLAKIMRMSGDDTPMRVWTVGGLVDVEGLNPIQSTLNTSETLPNTFCGHEETGGTDGTDADGRQ